MIKAENGTVRLEGHPALLEVELISAIKGFYLELVRIYDEDFAEKRIDFILDKVYGSDEVKAAQEDDVHEEVKDLLSRILKKMESEE